MQQYHNKSARRKKAKDAVKMKRAKARHARMVENRKAGWTPPEGKPRKRRVAVKGQSNALLKMFMKMFGRRG